MFGPEETVGLYAFASVGGTPANRTLVTFEIAEPVHDQKEVKFYQTAETNASGIAQTSFTLQVINQTDVFGTWSVIATAKLGGAVYSDALTFQVDYVVELISVRTLDGTLSERTSFGIDGYVGMKIALRNNARFKKDTLIGIVVFDELNVPISSIQIENFTVPPNGKTWYVFSKLYLPKFGVPGLATISVVAIRPDNAPYCPKIIAVFTITPSNPAFPDFVDASVYLDFLPDRVEPGETIPVNATARNEGTLTVSSFTVSLYVNGSLLDSKSTNTLDPYDSQKLNSYWDTRGLPEGNYTITASIPTFPNEADLSDNNYTSAVELKAMRPTFIHDLKLVNVTCSQHDVHQGEIINIEATVKNNGNTPESSNVGAYYDNFLIQEKSIINLAPGTEQTLVFQWNTMNVPEGTYVISATANPVEGETNISDNTYHDGTVIIRTRLPQIIHDVAVTALAASQDIAEAGMPIAVTGTVKNLGNVPEDFNTTFFCDSIPFSDLHIGFLAPSAEQTLTTVWDTSAVMEGNYTISAYAHPVPGETNLANNRLEDGVVTIKKRSAEVTHDIAVINISVDPTEVYAGENITIKVTVLNLGQLPESFNVTTYYDSNAIWAESVTSSSPYVPETITIEWNTTNVNPGVYTIIANATILESETNVENNSLKDGKVIIKLVSAISSWALVISILVGFIAIVASLVLLLLLLYSRRRRKKKPSQPRYSIIIHPHI